jgi:hypothetical protein
MSKSKTPPPLGLQHPALSDQRPLFIDDRGTR